MFKEKYWYDGFYIDEVHASQVTVTGRGLYKNRKKVRKLMHTGGLCFAPFVKTDPGVLVTDRNGKPGNPPVPERTLRRARLESGLSVEEVAEISGCTVETVRYWESEGKSPALAVRVLELTAAHRPVNTFKPGAWYGEFYIDSVRSGTVTVSGGPLWKARKKVRKVDGVDCFAPFPRASPPRLIKAENPEWGPPPSAPPDTFKVSRQAAGLSVSEAAGILKCSISTINRWEREGSAPAAATLVMKGAMKS